MENSRIRNFRHVGNEILVKDDGRRDYFLFLYYFSTVIFFLVL